VASGLNMSSNPKIDNWALGVILYYMLFGTYPFDGTNENDILHKITTQTLTFQNSIRISKTCKQIITRLLDKNPGFRLDLSDSILETWYEEG
jgi:serine/threonine protein kinase